LGRALIKRPLGLFYFAVFYFLFPPFCRGQAKPIDLLILSHPQSYSLLNRYEQTLSANEIALFRPFSPIEIETENAFLGDEITPALKCIVEKKQFFILKNTQGAFVGEKPAHERSLIKNCFRIDDTVTILKAKAIPFYKTFSKKTVLGYLGQDEHIGRIFQKKHLFFINRFEKQDSFGWAVLGSSQNWAEIMSQKTESVLDPLIQIENRIAPRLKEANESYRRTFGYLNRKTNNSKKVPQWHWRTFEKKIVCTLNAPFSKKPILEKSTKALVQDLRQLLMGTDYQVFLEQGRIQIQSKHS